METNDAWLAELVRRADVGENSLDTIDFSQTPAASEVDASEEKIEPLAEMICRAGNESAAALLVLMGTLPRHPQTNPGKLPTSANALVALHSTTHSSS